MSLSLRRFLVGWLGVLLPVAVLITTVFSLLLSGGFYDQIMLSANLSNYLPTLMRQGVTSAVEGSIAEKGSKAGLSSELVAEVSSSAANSVNQLLPQILSSGIIQELISNNIDNLLAYFNDGTTELYVYLPRENIRDLLGQLSNLVTEIAMLGSVRSIPVCADDVLAEYASGQLTCLPENLTTLLPPQPIALQFAGQISFAEVVENQIPVIAGENNQPLADTLRQAKFQGPTSPIVVVATVKDVIAIARYLLIFTWIVILAVCLTMVLLDHRDVYMRVRALGRILATLCLGFTFPAWILYFISDRLIQGLLAPRLDVPLLFRDIVLSVLTSAWSQILLRFCLLGTILVCLGFALYFVPRWLQLRMGVARV